MKVRLFFVLLLLFILSFHASCEGNSFAYDEKVDQASFEKQAKFILQSTNNNIIIIDQKIDNIKMQIYSIEDKLTKYSKLYTIRN